MVVLEEARHRSSVEGRGEHEDQADRAVQIRHHLEVLGDPLGPCHDIRLGTCCQCDAADGAAEADEAAPAHSTETGSGAAARHRGSAEGAAHTEPAAVVGCSAVGDSSAADMLEGMMNAALAQVQAQAHGDYAHDPIALEAAGNLGLVQEDSSAQLGVDVDARRVVAGSRIVVGEDDDPGEVHCDIPVPHHDRDLVHLHVAASQILDHSPLEQRLQSTQEAAGAAGRSRSQTL